MSPRVSIPHIAALDGLRGSAVAAVLLFHGGHMIGGYLGVDLFFVLSGFLITGLLLAESGGSGHVALGGFWARRARRLLPALFLVLLGVAVYCVVFADPAELDRIRGDALATIGYVANWRSIFAGQDYWALFTSPSPLEHTWSLAIEEQFYLVWPLVFVGLLKWRKQRTPRAVLATALLGAAVSSALMIALFEPTDPSRVYFGTDTRASAVLMGAALAAALVIFGHVRGRVARIGLEIAGLGGAAVLAAMWTRLGGQAPRLYRGGFLVAGIAAVLVIAAAVHPSRGVLARVLSFRPLCWLGLISYGLYLWHWPVDIVLDADRVGLTGWPLFAVQTAVALAIAVASYQLVEMPIRRGALNRRQWQLAGPALATALLVAMIVTTAAAESPAKAAGIDAAKPGGLLVVGDSVANTVGPGLERAGLDATTVWAPGCRLVTGRLPFQNAFSNNCPWRKGWRESVAKAKPKTVLVISGAWDLFDIKPPGSRQALVPGTLEWARYYRGAVEQAIDILGAGGATVVFPTVPCQGLVPGKTPFGDGSSIDVERVEAANAVLRLVERDSGGKVVMPDLFGYLCPTGKYQRALAGVDPVRSDGVHFTEAGGDLVTDFLLPYLDAVPASEARAPASGRGGSTGPRVLVLGDSVANTLGPGLERAGLDATTVWSPGCRLVRGELPFENRFSSGCDWSRDWRLAMSRARPDVVVVVIGTWDLFDVKPPNGGTFLAPGSLHWARYYRGMVEEAIALLGADGARIVFPTIPCQGRVPGDPAFAAGSAADVARVRAANAVLDLVDDQTEADLEVPDLFAYLCPTGGYQRDLAGVDPVRSDGAHFTEAGADLVADFLMPYVDPDAAADDGAS